MPHDQYLGSDLPSDPSDPFETRLSSALRDTGGLFDTDRASLVAAGAARGRRLKLRRRAAVFGGAATVVAAAVGGALVLPGGGSGAGSGQQAGAVGARPKASPTASATPAPAGVTKQQMISTLVKLLPKGEVSEQYGRGTDENPGYAPLASVVFDDGKGPAAITVGLQRVQPGSDEARETVQCPDKVYIPHDDCRTTRLADGSVVMVFQGYEYPDRRVDTKHWLAELVTPTGQHVSVMEWNSAQEKDAPISRPEPPLDPAALTRLAAAQEWRGLVDDIPVDPRQQSGGPTRAPEQPGAPVRSTLQALLPKGLDVVGRSGNEAGFGYLVVDDGKGASLVQVNVQTGMGGDAKSLFDSGDETLPDGTRVAVHQGPGEKGGEGVVMWTVDTLRPDGRRVVISAFNSGTQHDAATRETPALTIAQMRTIALSPQWWK
ncbi:hypothetical protein [Streptomyces griseosporeus]|uniref:hypothetical protein n=1 Tax=Streptomyces griseosporeus TaxID=1910 RepID=UPI0036FDAF77